MLSAITRGLMPIQGAFRFMRFKGLITFSAIALLAASISAENITGTILIKKSLTKKSVTAPVPVYQRGPVVELAKTTADDPLSYERSRVVIYLEGPNLGGVVPAGPDTVQIEQLNRNFVPDLAVVPAGSTISFPNMDPIFHSVFSLSKPKAFDLGSYDKGDTRKVLFAKPGIVDVFCRLHPNMTATIIVTPNRYYARSDSSGQYHIEDVPPGQYTIVAWHKFAGFFRKPITVTTGHDAIADFFIPLEADSK
jgi:plastocyanin